MKNLVIIIVLLVLMCACDSFKSKNSEAMPCSEQILINTLQSQIVSLQTDNAWLRQQLALCTESKLGSNQRKAIRIIPTQPTTQTPKDNLGQNTTPPPSNPTVPEPPKGSTSIADLSGLYDDGIIQFCVMANQDRGLHFPEKALESGVTFSSIAGNPDKNGHNFVVKPVPFFDGDYGVTEDGIFFVSNELLVKVLALSNIKLVSLAIKAPFTKWQLKEMKLVDDYWIYKAI